MSLLDDPDWRVREYDGRHFLVHKSTTDEQFIDYVEGRGE